MLQIKTLYELSIVIDSPWNVQFLDTKQKQAQLILDRESKGWWKSPNIRNRAILGVGNHEIKQNSNISYMGRTPDGIAKFLNRRSWKQVLGTEQVCKLLFVSLQSGALHFFRWVWALAVPVCQTKLLQTFYELFLKYRL